MSECDSQPVTTIALQITMAVTDRTAGGPAATTRAAAPSGGSGYCACHCRERGGPSGDNARRSPFWRLWVLHLPLQRARGAQRRQRAPQTSFSQHLQCDSEPARTNTMEITMAVVHRHSVRTSWPQPLQCDSQPVTTIALQITMAVTHRTAGGPAATTRAAAPSGGSGYCACHCRERGGPSGDNARRSPFLEALGTAPATAESEGGTAATTRAAAPSGGSGYCACHCRERGGPSGDIVRRSPFWRLWVLRLPLQRARGAQRRLWVLRLPLQRERGAQRRQRAPQPLLQSQALGV